MDVYELHAIFFRYLLAPLRYVVVVTTLYVVLAFLLVDGIEGAANFSLAFMLFVAWGEREDYGYRALLLAVNNHLVEIPSV